MTPIDISLISRKVASRSKVRRIYLISEGILTEPSFLKSVLTDSPYLDNQLDMDFYATERSGKEFGINTIQGMVDLAYANIINNSNRFSKKKDKVIIFFDLDIYQETAEEIKRIVNAHKKYIIFVFVNPAIELFLLLCKENSYEEIIEPHVKEILKNEKVPATGRRYIYQLLIDSIGKDPKDADTNFKYYSDGLEHAIRQEKLYLSKIIKDPHKFLISNFGSVIESIKEGNIDNIEYTIL